MQRMVVPKEVEEKSVMEEMSQIEDEKLSVSDNN
jgi:hypothetical protein